MAERPGTVTIPDAIEVLQANGEVGLKPVTFRNRNQGGWFQVLYKTLDQSVAPLECRNAIPWDMLTVGMVCVVMSEGELYNGLPVGIPYRLISLPNKATLIKWQTDHLDEYINPLWYQLTESGGDNFIKVAVSNGQTEIDLPVGVTVVKRIIVEGVSIFADATNRYFSVVENQIIWSNNPPLEETDVFVIVY